MKTYLFTRRSFDGNQQIDETRAVTAEDTDSARALADCGNDWHLGSYAEVAVRRTTTTLTPGTLAYRRLEHEKDEALREVARLKDAAVDVMLLKSDRDKAVAFANKIEQEDRRLGPIMFAEVTKVAGMVNKDLNESLSEAVKRQLNQQDRLPAFLEWLQADVTVCPYGLCGFREATGIAYPTRDDHAQIIEAFTQSLL